MRSSAMTRRLGAFTGFIMGGVSVLLFHGAAFAQQTDPGSKAPVTKEATRAGKTAKATPAKAAGGNGTAADTRGTQKASPAAASPAGAAAAAPEAAPETQQPAPPQLPPGYEPPPGYGAAETAPPSPPPYYGPPAYGPYYREYYGPPAYPPPPRYYYRRHFRPGPRYYPEPITYRPFFFGVGLGVGGVAVFPVSGAGDTATRAGVSYNLHFGFGVSPRWSIVLSGDGAYSNFNANGSGYGGYSVDQSVWSIGPQVFLTRNLYLRVGIGVATKSVDYNSDYYYSDYYYGGFTDSGMGGTAALGWEFLQSYHTSVGLEAAATMGHYANPDPVTNSKNQGTIGINFVLNLF